MGKRRARTGQVSITGAAAWGASFIGTASPMVIATAQQFALAVEAAASFGELGRLVDAITREMGFRYFALTHHVDMWRAPHPAIRIHNYPPDWEAFFDAEGLGRSDPVHRASHLRNLGFPWAMLRELIDLTRRDEDILLRSRRAGLADGYTVPAHLPGEAEGSCSFATVHGRSYRVEWIPLAQYVGTAAFEAARRLSGMRRTDLDRPRLSDRQRDCIYWAARGKSEWETAQILGIGHGTAVQHMKEARRRYGVFNKTQLAIHALYDGALTFTDAMIR
jgi:DNA-binding CsgD family transcriptional regulator